MPLIVDAHEDLAWNMLTYGRDYLRSVQQTRELEAGSDTILHNGDTMLGWPAYQAGRVGLVFATLFAAPLRWKTHTKDTQVYSSVEQAAALYRRQVDVYRQLVDAHPDKFRLIISSSQLADHIRIWQVAFSEDVAHDDSHPRGSSFEPPIGLVLLMEGADAIRDPDELAEWFDRGVRLVGPAWVATRYTGGWREPGPLTQDGKSLLKAMADLNLFLDVSHMDEPAAMEAVGSYPGPIVGTHGNCLALLPGYPTNRQFTDRLIRAVIERDGVIGLVPYNIFLKVGWTRQSNRRDEVHMTDLINHIDHVCQLAGDALHAGIGTDFDGGFGLQSAPIELDSIADLQLLAGLLVDRGYSQADAANILGGNWLSILKRELP